MSRASVHSEQRASKINTLHKGNISREELFVVFVSRTEYLPSERAGMQSNIVP